jgi:peptide deformylase
MFKIVQSPDPVLAKVAQKIPKIDKTIHDLIKDMIVTLEAQTDPEGVGLAAPQIGKSLQLFIIKENPDSPVSVFINPAITLESFAIPTPTDATGKDKKKKKETKLEGCLSLQDIWGVVHRSPKVTITYQNEKGENKTETYDGFFATIIQHEYDHLQGILFPRRVLEQKGKLYKSTKEKNGENIFEEIEL